MIPKKIHYCWFGGKELPPLAKKCIKSWKKYCPDYEIIQWNESNYDINKNEYMKSAYTEKKWGFVPDYARFDIIYNNGGIYLDTDVELIKPLDSLLSLKGFMGFENNKMVNGGLIIAGEPELDIFREMYECYNNVSFYNTDGSLNLLPSPHYNTEVLLEHGLIKNNITQIIDSITVFSSEYFCPKDVTNVSLKITEDTYSIHHYDGSWIPGYERFAIKFAWVLTKLFGEKVGKSFVDFCRFKVKKLLKK